MSKRIPWRKSWTRRSNKRTLEATRRRVRRFEWLEPRWALAAPTLAALNDVTLLAGAPLNIALNGADTDNDALTYTVTSTNSALTPIVAPSSNHSLRIQVDDAANDIHGTIVLKLFDDLAPKTVARITQLANSGFYNGLTFHRVIKDFMIQGGDPQGTGSGGSGTDFDDEFNPSLLFTGRGLLAMAKSGDDTNDSQFFITSKDTRWLDFNHTIFGMMTEGDSILAAIENVATNSSNKPTSNVVMTSVQVIQDSQDNVLRLSVPKGTTGQSDVTVVVSDGHGGTATRTFHVSIQADPNTPPPFLQPIDPLRTSVNTPVSITIPVTNVSGVTAYYAAEVSPANANLTVTCNAATGLLTVTPKNGATGVFSIKVKVANSTAFSDSTSSSVDTQVVPVYVSTAAPVVESLLPDTGSSHPAGTTSHNNASADSTLTFHLTGLTANAEVTLYADGQVIGQAVATGSVMDVHTNGTTALLNGIHSITAIQTLRNQTVQVGNLNTTTDIASPASSALSITVAATSSGAPTVTGFQKSVAQNGTLAFTSADFSSHFSASTSATLQKVKFTALPTHGTLKLSGANVDPNQEIPLASLANLTYVPTTSYSGTDSITWTGSDGTAYATNGALVTLTVGGTSSSGSASLAGSVYVGVNHEGPRNPLKGVGIQLQQQANDGTWNIVNSTMTDASGNYRFANLAAGTYKLLEIAQPSSYADGPETVGTAGGTAGSDVITAIALDAGEAATGYLFGEAGVAGNLLSLRLFLLNTPPVTEYLATLNQAPSVDLNGSSSGTGNSATYTTGSDAVKIASSAKIADSDGGCLNSMTVTITNLRDGDSEVLAATTTGTGITANYSGGVLQLTGAASLAAYQTVLQSITYKNSDATPTAGDRAISVAVSDGISTSQIATATVKTDISSTAPTATVTTAPTTIKASSGSTSTTTVVVTYADADNGIDTTSFGTADITVSNGATVTSYSANGNVVTYTIKAPSSTWAASTQGTYTIALVANQVKDKAGNYVAANSSLATFKVDTVVPTASVTTAPPTITSANSSGTTTTVTVTYADSGLGIDTTSFSTSNITVNNGATVTAVSANGNAVTYTIKSPAATWGASTQGTYTIALVASQVKDLAGNYVAANSSLASFTVDMVNPTAAVTTAPTPVNAAHAGENTITLTVTYSPSTSGSALDTTSFAKTNLTVSNNATVDSITVNGNAVTYTIKAPQATWGASTQGTYTVSLAANQVKDLAGHYVAAVSGLTSFVVDATVPTASVTTAPPTISASSAGTNTTTLTVTYADTAGIDTTSLAKTNLTVSNNATVDSITVNGNAVTYTIKAPQATWGTSTQGTYTIGLAANQVKDLAGNYVAANASLATFKVDTAVPTASVTTSVPPITASNASENTTTLTVTYSDSGLGLDTNSLKTSNLTVDKGATVTAVSANGNVVTYTIKAPQATWGASTQGTYTVSLVANQVKDLAGNYVAANASLASFTVNTSSSPTASVVRDGSQVTVTGSPGVGLMEFTVGANSCTVEVNGQSYEYNISDVTTFNFDGVNSDEDIVQLNGGDAAQTAEIHPTWATYHSGSITVNVVNAKDIRIYAGSGDSEVSLYDSPGDDMLFGGNTLAMLSGADFAEMVLDFKRVKAYGTAGGQNSISMEAVDFVLTKEGSWTNL